MIPKAWIFFTFCFAHCTALSQADIHVCAAAQAEYGELASLLQAVDNLTALFTQVAGGNSPHNIAQAQQTVAGFCPYYNMSAQAVEKVIKQCASTAGQCPERRFRAFSVDVFRAAAKFCEDFRIEEYTEHIRTLVPCQAALYSDTITNQFSLEDAVARYRLYALAESDSQAAEENSTVSCGFGCGRECACRWAQIAAQAETGEPKRNIREVCGQRAMELLQEVVNRVMNALNCSEFGDYVREWGWLKINYRANQTTPATHR